MTRQDTAPLYGRVFITADIKVVTGLHIGAAASTVNVGGLDNAVVRDPLTNQPYIPGSSLRGKMRSLSEKFQQKAQNHQLQEGVRIHICREKGQYKSCDVCRIYGILPSDKIPFSPTRLVVRDAFLHPDSVTDLESTKTKTDMPYTEVKWEATIDRVTSQAVPRQMERVPARAVFKDCEMVYSIYQEGDIGILWRVIEAMQLLQDDYLGGLGARGSGKIEFKNIRVSCRSHPDYGNLRWWKDDDDVKKLTLEQLWQQKDALIQWVEGQITIETGPAETEVAEG